MAEQDIDTFDAILTSLGSMEKQGKVDESVLSLIDFLAQSFDKSENRWLKDETASSVDAFVLFHAYRNAGSVLQQAKTRFASATEMHDNPKVVDDAMLVFPPVLRLFTTVKSLEGQDLTPGLRSLILAHVRTMRNAAAQANMLPQDVDPRVDSSKVSEQAKSLAETFREILSET